jgi:hypothetical protein
VLCYQVLKTGKAYQERGLPVLDEKQRNRLICHHVRRLGQLVIRVRSLTLDKQSSKRKQKAHAGNPNKVKAESRQEDTTHLDQIIFGTTNWDQIWAGETACPTLEVRAIHTLTLTGTRASFGGSGLELSDREGKSGRVKGVTGCLGDSTTRDLPPPYRLFFDTMTST